METKRIEFKEKGFDEEEYKKYFHQNQAEYLRKRLRSVCLYHEGKKFEEIAVILSQSEQSVRKYVNTYIESGFKALCEPITRAHKSRLTPEQCKAFKEVLLTKRPNEVGLEGNIWTGNIMCTYLKNTYDVTYKKGIYDLLERLRLSHQRAHSDYDNANKEEQKAFIAELKEALLEADEQTAVIKFDEFSVQSKPSSYYGWAEKNTRPKVKTNEKK